MDCRKWPSEGVRRASINSFGFGGSNCHLVIDDAKNYLGWRNMAGNHCTTGSVADSRLMNHTMPRESPCEPGKSTSAPNPKLFVWSAASEYSLRCLTKDYGQHFADLSGKESLQYFENLAYTLSSRRSTLAWRSYLVAHDVSDLQNLEEAKSKPLRFHKSQPKLGLIFTGQGAQWPGMARELNVYSVFRESLVRSQMYLAQLGCEWTLISNNPPCNIVIVS